MNTLKRILSKIGICIIALSLMGGLAHGAMSNLPNGGTIGDGGAWNTPANQELINNNMRDDIDFLRSGFNQNQLVSDYVPVEAKVGLAFMNALSWVGEVLDRSLVRFVIIFMIIGYAFWIMLETYAMMIKGDGNVKKLAEEIVKKGGLIAIWIIVLNFGAAKLFLYVMGPVLVIGTTIADFILNAITSVAGVSLPDTCAAIREYAATNTSPDMLIDANMAANVMCLPTRLSGFFYTAISAGFQWMWHGIGHSFFEFLAGAIFVCLFTVNMWKFALMALGVIADLFMSILMLPFTALTETLGKQTSYKGIAGDVFKGFMGLFSAETLSAQIQRFINAAIYFVSLSIVIAICVALLSGTITTDLSARDPVLENAGYLTTLLTGCLVWYLSGMSEKLAKQIGGSINSAMGEKMGADAANLTKVGYKKVTSAIKFFRKK